MTEKNSCNNNSDETYFRLYRKLIKSQVFQNPDLLKVWIWCLAKATFKERWISVTTGKGETEVHLMPGQFIFGRDTAAVELRMKPTSARDRMKKLQKMQNISIKSASQYSIVTVLNWGVYQNGETEIRQAIRQASADHPPGIRQASATNKNVLNALNASNDLNVNTCPELKSAPNHLPSKINTYCQSDGEPWPEPRRFPADTCPEPETSSADEVTIDELPIMYIATTDAKQSFPVTESMVEAWQKENTAIKVKNTLKLTSLWFDRVPDMRKRYQDTEKFISEDLRMRNDIEVRIKGNRKKPPAQPKPKLELVSDSAIAEVG